MLEIKLVNQQSVLLTTEPSLLLRNFGVKDQAFFCKQSVQFNSRQEDYVNKLQHKVLVTSEVVSNWRMF